VQLLPIDPLLPEIVRCLTRGTRLVLRAPPGAGKTTRVPAALLDAGLAGLKHLVVLEPRRIAARAAAAFVAAERGSAVGGEVGYRVRFEQQGGDATRLWFLTEGILGRQLLRDPFLEAVGLVVLDEFHERHLQGDVALAVIRELQETVRPDLKLVVMSATLDTERLAAYLDDCPILTAAGRAYPVDIEYAAEAGDHPLAARIVRALQRLLTGPADDGGDVLVFLPGAAEIRRTAEALEPLAAAHHLAIVLLHGDLPLEAQQQAIRRGPRRKVVLSTNVAESALTIDGVTAVIDSGLAREARVDTRHGINALRVVPISRAAADQRAGRAGRTAPGRCVRLWPAAEHAHRREHEVPEILRLDLSATVLELRAWGLRDARSFHWLDPPSAAVLERAEQLLLQLGAIDAAQGSVTAVGRRMLGVSVAPRLARILVEADEQGCPAAGALLAALASERDICLEQRAFGAGAQARWPAGPSDLLLRMQLFREAEQRHFGADACRALGLDVRAVRAVERARRQLRSALAGRRGDSAVHDLVDEETLLRCTLAGFPDRVVRRRASGSPRGVMVGGTGVVLDPSSIVREAELFVAVEVDAGPRRALSESRVRVASAVRREWLAMFPGALHVEREVVFDAARERVVERRRERFADLVLDETVQLDVDRWRAGEVLAEAARRDPARALQFTAAAQHWLRRVQFVQRWMPDAGFPADIDAWLAGLVADWCAGRRSFAELRAVDVLGALRAALTPVQQRALDRDAPDSYQLPSGRATPVLYEDGKPPAVAARIQEIFGLRRTPRLAAGRVALVFHLLAPNQRPVQITDDLESFWRSTYPEVRKVLRGRYPKHAWPEDPLTATPTSRVGRAR
jgi:ATP-dependent RNA helicase HrpB